MDKVYYISQGNTPEQHLDNIQTVCEAGGRLVQLRMKEVSFDVYLETAKKAKQITDLHQALLIINDQVEIAIHTKAAGVHVGKSDTDIEKAKSMLLPGQIIGGTANTLEDCQELMAKGVDYIGLGPFRFTTTKKNLSPVLGVIGYQEILGALPGKGVMVPVFAIGGIEEEDIQPLIATGVYGVAVSGLLTGKSSDTIKKILNRVEQPSLTAK